MPVIWIFTISWDRYTIYLKKQFSHIPVSISLWFPATMIPAKYLQKTHKVVFLQAAPFGLQPRRFSASDWGNPRSTSRTLTGHRMSPDATGCHRILENLETDHLQSQNRSVRSAEYPQNWLGNRGPQSDSPSWSWRRDLQLLALAKSSWSHSLAAAWRIPRSGNAMKFGHFAMISSPRLARTC